MSVLEELNEQGFTVLADAVEPDLLDAIALDIERMESDGKQAIGANYFSGFSTIRFHNLLSEGDVWQSVALYDPVLEVATKVLGPDYLLSLMGTALVGPGATEQPMHCDDDIYELPRMSHEIVLNTVWALSDFTDKNGATRVVPGSHLYDSIPNPNDGHETVPLEMGRGSIAFVLGRTWHAAGANRSDARRDGVLVNYCHCAMRQFENHLLCIDPERVETFDPALKALLGLRPTRIGVGMRPK